ncbi:MAG: rRNA maturation RNase YbeY [Rickettsiales bacterium]|nr:rRNA maturation RNase YbeY [Rickettsiales bacterium]|tara:strand:- start:3703 stop:4176 length:474 start_codon:yes stop_codon:yes gene_type:complete
MIEFNFEYLGSFSECEIKRIVKKAISEVLKEMDFKKKYYISVLLTNNNGIKKINRRYRKINKSTNVLSFSQNDERFITKKTSKIILGDIVISLEKIKKESKLQNKQSSDHLTHMVIHSLLHLLGFNHEKLKDFRIMKQKEINVLSKLSISSPYAIND